MTLLPAPVLAIDVQLGSYRISLDQAVSPENAANAVQAASIINGTIVPSNGYFSFDDAVGGRTSSRGFIEGLVTSGNGYTSGYGGGICMTSSILNQAVKSAGLKVIERHDHSHSSGYLPVGEDAAITRGVEDYQFQNTCSYPVMIRAYTIKNALEICLVEQCPYALIIQFDGKVVNFEETPLLKENQVLIPIRPLAQVIGASLFWDQKNQSVVISRDGQKVELTIDSVIALYNGRTILLETPPQIVDGRVFVPLRIVAQSMNLLVTWDGIQKKVLLSSPTQSDLSLIQGQTTALPAPGDYRVGTECWSLKYPDNNGNIYCEMNLAPKEVKDCQYSLLIGNIATPKLLAENQSSKESLSNQKCIGVWTAKELDLKPGSYDCRLIIGSGDKKWLSDDVKVITVKEAMKLSSDAYPMANPEEWLVFNESSPNGIDPVFAGRLAALARDHNQKICINSGFRTFQEQTELYQTNHGIGTTLPGYSWHEFGEAVDSSSAWVIQIDNVQILSQALLSKSGLCKPLTTGNNYSPSENWHLQPIETACYSDLTTGGVTAIEIGRNFYQSYSQ